MIATKRWSSRRRRAVYGELVRQCAQAGLVAPSYKTFCLKVTLRDHYDQTLKRRGPRAAYQVGEFVSYLDRRPNRHGDRPFEIAHVDHTEADIEVRHSRTGRVLGRPWLTFMIDAFSRRILAFHLTFDPAELPLVHGGLPGVCAPRITVFPTRSSSTAARSSPACTSRRCWPCTAAPRRHGPPPKRASARSSSGSSARLTRSSSTTWLATPRSRKTSGR